MYSGLSRVWLFFDPMDCSLPGSYVSEISQARILEWVAISSSRASSQPRDRTCVSCISCLSRQIRYHCAIWKAHSSFILWVINQHDFILLLKSGACLWHSSAAVCVTMNILTFHSFLLNFIEVSAAAKSLQSCPTLCDPIDGSPPGSPVPGILQARTLEWVATALSNAWKWNGSRSVMSNSSRPHGLQPTRLLRPWDFPGESTGVGCRGLLDLKCCVHFCCRAVMCYIHSFSYYFPL